MSAAADYVRFYVTVHTKGEGKLTAATEKALPKGSGEGWARFYAGPLPVLMIGLVLALAQVTGRAWLPLDAADYWEASFRLGDLYPATWSAYAYNFAAPPPIAQAFSLVHGLPWPLVLIAWQTFLFGCLWYACRGWTLAVIAVGLVGIGAGLPYVAAPLGLVLLGNAGMLMTAGVVATVRDPRAGVIPFLAKIGPSVALLYHGRRAWPGVVAIVVGLAISVALTPSAWPEWIAFVVRNYAAAPVGELAIPFFLRAPVGALIVVYAARTRRPWLVPIGSGLCVPADYGASFLTVWVGALAFAPSPAALAASLRGRSRRQPVRARASS
jgi:hypothetical protein